MAPAEQHNANEAVGAALRDFSEALFAFSDDPSRRNLARYLDASRALEASRGAKARRRRRRSG
jgi:hypothetical protein